MRRRRFSSSLPTVLFTVCVACGSTTHHSPDQNHDAAAATDGGSRGGAKGTNDATGGTAASAAGGTTSAAGGTAGVTGGAGGAIDGNGGAPQGAGGQPDTARDAAVDGPTTRLPGWTLVFGDEFGGPAGAVPDATKWVHETGGTGWGNDELEYYTDRPENAAMDGNGALVITARAEAYKGRDYTSARLKTAGKFDHEYGRFEARIQIPQGQGLWPAFWLLGSNIDTVGWPACGEIDVMENIGKEPATVHGTIHGPNYGPGGSFSLPDHAPFGDAYHVYAVEWEAAAIRFYVDGSLYETQTRADLPGGAEWEFSHPFFVLLNVAVGGQWPGAPDGTTTFPQKMRVDYVRVYDREP